MKKIKSSFSRVTVGVVVSTLLLSVLVGATPSTHVSNQARIVLTKANTLSLHTVVTMDSVAKLQVQAFEKSRGMSESDQLYLVLNTPGGSVPAGNEFIDTIKSLTPKVSTITIFAASMGFHIAQNLGVRYAIPHAVYMSHRMFVGGMEGQIPGNLVTEVTSLVADAAGNDNVIAKRMGISLHDYQELIRDEFWTNGRDAIDLKVADQLAAVTCGPDLTGSTTETLSTMFGPIDVIYSDCPLIIAPLGVDLSKVTVPTGSKQYNEMLKFVDELTNKKSAFVDDYIVNNKFVSIVGK